MTKREAIKQAKQRALLSRLVAGLDHHLLPVVFAFEPMRRGALYRTYEALYGPHAINYLQYAFPLYVVQKMKPGGNVAARLLYVGSAFLTEGEMQDVVSKWQGSKRIQLERKSPTDTRHRQMLRICQGNEEMASEILLAVKEKRICRLPKPVPIVERCAPPPVPPAVQPEPIQPPEPVASPPEPEAQAAATGLDEPVPAADRNPPAAAPPSRISVIWARCVYFLRSAWRVFYLTVIGIFLLLVALGILAIYLDSSRKNPPPPPAATPVEQAAPAAANPSEFETSKKLAAQMYPDLNNYNSQLNVAVRQEIDRLRDADSPELSLADAPLTITDRVAARLGVPPIRPGSDPAASGIMTTLVPPVATPVPQQVEVKYVHKQHRGSTREPIANIGGVNRDGSLWNMSQGDAIAAIQAGKYAFYVSRNGRVAKVKVATSRAGNLMLTTVRDGFTGDNLLSLPDFPQPAPASPP